MMTGKQKRIILQRRPLCEKCLQQHKYVKATEVTDGGEAVCKPHYDRYIAAAYDEIYFG